MSYEGTYGADETCRHDQYWRSCGECSLVGPRATKEQVALALSERSRIYAEREATRVAKLAERHVYRVVKDGLGNTLESELLE